MADFPRNIRLSSMAEARLKSYLNSEIENHRAERSNWVNDLKNWQIDYWAAPLETQKTFPFKGASNIVIPMTAIAVESVHAKAMTTLTGVPGQFVTLKLPPQISDSAPDTEKIIDHILLKDVKFVKFADEALLENKKLGSAIGKTGYERIVKRAVREEGGVEIPFDVVTKQGACIDAVPLPNFLMPFTCNDPQTAPWCGEEHLENPYQVKLHANSGFFYPELAKDENMMMLLGNGIGQNQSSTEYVQEVRKLQNQTPIQWPREISWFEFWLSFDVDEDGNDEEIVVHYHWESGTFLSIRYNWYSDLHRPYRICNYFPMEHRWAGIGIGKQNEQFQAEITTQHRQRIDNATLANMRMYKIKQGIGYGPNESIFPGKIWLVEDMDDIGEIQMAEVYPSSYNNEQQAVIYSQQRTAVNELNQGMPQMGTPGTASSDLIRVQEGNRKFDYTFGNEKAFLVDCMKDVLCVTNQYGVSDQRIFRTVAAGPIVEHLLTKLSPDELKLYVLSELNLAGASANRLVDRATLMQLAQTTTGYYQNMIALAQQSQNPQLMMMLSQQAFVAGSELMKQIFEAFDIRSIDKLIPPPLLQLLMTNGSNVAGLIGSGGPGSTNPGNQNGVESGAQSGGEISAESNAGTP